MTKADVIAQIAEKTGIDKADVSVTVEAFFNVVKNSMAEGENIYVRGFGSFTSLASNLQRYLPARSRIAPRLVKRPE